jgi:hypothetical protein
MPNKRKNNNQKKNEENKKRKIEEINITSKEEFDKFINILFPPPPPKLDETKDIQSDGYDNCNEEEEKDIFEILNVEKITLVKLIEWGDLYHNKKKKICGDINLKTLWRLKPSLIKLKDMVGLDNVKDSIVKQIIYFLQNLENGKNDMMHTLIEGSPGVGKTELGKILGEIYIKMGILKTNKVNINDPNMDITKIFRIVKRSDLIGKYLGHTASQTQEVIDSCEGGILFIDEVYSLGNFEKRDSFSKECIDTINRNLSEKQNFICIIAGYAKDIEKCFFAVNEGLKRRFPFKYTIEKYSPEELCEIFLLKVKKLGWKYSDNKNDLITFFKKNIKSFKHFGGDIETLFLNCKIQHGLRVFGKKKECKKKIVLEDINNGYKLFVNNKSKSKIETMYI